MDDIGNSSTESSTNVIYNSYNTLTLVYTGDIAVGDSVCIDASDYTVDINNINALDKFSGNFPKIMPNLSTLVYSDSVVSRSVKVMITWRDKIV
ncbi:MAG: hypothetical protein WC248_07745 [Candidatus Methanomethylophilaceae archaeon]|jgi:hypothetical protein